MVNEIERQRWRRQKRQAALSQKCPAKSCMAPKGRPCRDRSGKAVAYFHVGRLDAGLRKIGTLVG